MKNNQALSVELTLNDLKTINDSASPIHSEGERYPEALEKTVGR